MVVGILALQGCVEPHAEHLRKLGAEPRYVRLPADLSGIEGLILPGGESTTMLKLLKIFELWEPLKNQATKIPFWGICAGAILMAEHVENPQQESLNIMSFTVRRNAYGRQIDSFQQKVITDHGAEDAVFIRAPKFISWAAPVKVAGRVGEEVVFLEQGTHMASAFHPELTPSSWCHQKFLKKITST